MLRLDVDDPPTHIPLDNPHVGPGDRNNDGNHALTCFACINPAAGGVTSDCGMPRVVRVRPAF